MGYEFYLDKMLLPITPSSFSIKIKGQNKTYNLINEGEINVLKEAGLSDIEFDAVFPNYKYPFSTYKNGFVTADAFLEQLESLQVSKKPFQFIITRAFPNGKNLYSTNLKVSLENYTMKEDKKEGMDVKVSIKLKQYKEYSTKTCQVVIKQKSDDTTSTTATISDNRETSNAPNSATYTVKKGDCLWNIAKMFYGNGSYYTNIYNANKDKIKNPNLIYPGQVLTIPKVSSSAAPAKINTKQTATKKTTTVSVCTAFDLHPTSKANSNNNNYSTVVSVNSRGGS